MAIPLAITAMLVMYTLKGTITSQLPGTSYVKFVDVWLLYGLLMPFIILIVIVLIEHLPEESKVMETKHESKKHKLLPIKILHLITPDPVKTTKTRVFGQAAWKKFGRVFLPIIQLVFAIIYAVVAFILYIQ